MRQAVTRTATVVVNVAAVLGVLAVLGLAAALVWGLRPVVLRSGSMSPTMPTGTLALTVPVAADEIEVGQVVTVPTDDGDLVTHRVVQVAASGAQVQVELRGDANPVPDAQAYDVTDGARRVVADVPWLGRLVAAVRGPWLVAGAAALVVIALLPGKPRERRDREPAPTGSVPAQRATTIQNGTTDETGV